MRLVQFHPKDNCQDLRLGYLSGDNIVDVCCNGECGMPNTMLQVLKAGMADQLIFISNKTEVPMSSVTLVAPINGMDKILAIGPNFTDQCEEVKRPPPAHPLFFSKFSSSIIGPNEPVRIRTDVAKKVDWEVELAVVIGKKASSVAAAEADKYIFGYTIAQDISDREWQKEKNGPHFLLGKSMDTFCPIGPWIVTADEIGIKQAHNLKMVCSINGVVKQNSNTSNYVSDIGTVIERASSVMTLFPGDLILTGTPAGIGDNLDPKEYLKPGDVIHSEIESIGVLVTPVEQF